MKLRYNEQMHIAVDKIASIMFIFRKPFVSRLSRMHKTSLKSGKRYQGSERAVQFLSRGFTQQLGFKLFYQR